jgi:hypothetical protein
MTAVAQRLVPIWKEWTGCQERMILPAQTGDVMPKPVEQHPEGHSRAENKNHPGDGWFMFDSGSVRRAWGDSNPRPLVP